MFWGDFQWNCNINTFWQSFILVLILKAKKKYNDLIKHPLLRMQFSNNKNTKRAEMSTSDVLTSQLMASIYKGGNLSSSKIPPLQPQ